MSWGEPVSLERVQQGLELARSLGWWGPEHRRLLFHDLQRVTAHIGELRAAFPDDAVHGVAIKANPLVELLRVMVEAGAGLEAASWEEVQCAVAAGCPGDRIIFDSPAKSTAELEQALELGVWLNTDNEAELQRVAALGPRAARIGLRVNPQIGAGRIGITSTVGKGSKFGEPLQRAGELAQRYPFLTGLHVHTGSQGCGLELLGKAAQATDQAVSDLGLQWLDVGGGLPVRYTAADPEPPTVQDWADALSGLDSWGKRPILTELGRSLQAGSGWAVSRIEAVKEVAGRPLYVVHLGADFLLRRVYRPDDWDNRMVVLDPQGRPKSGRVQADVGGPLCFSGDLLARDRSLAPAEPGDLLLIRDTGAYTLSMWSRHCSRAQPPVLGLWSDRAQPLFAGESVQDVVRAWSLQPGTPAP